jgi:hypothetical protein
VCSVPLSWSYVYLTFCVCPFSQESYSNADIDPSTGKPLDVGVSDLERKGSAKGNAGFFEKGLMTALESNHRSGGVQREVKVVANGHCHSTSLLNFAIYVDSTTTTLQSLKIADVSRAPGCVSAVEGTHGVIPDLRTLTCSPCYRSYSGYGKLGFDRRFRIFDISDYGETIRTYKRTENDEIIDQMDLAGDGAPAPWEGV